MLEVESIGQSIPDHEILAKLRTLNRDITFDVCGAKGVWHPRIETMQGVFCGDRHLCAIGRGNVPEFDIWSVRKTPWGGLERAYIVNPGWRKAFQKMVNMKVPGITWENLCRIFGIEYKHFVGDPHELEDVPLPWYHEDEPLLAMP